MKFKDLQTGKQGLLFISNDRKDSNHSLVMRYLRCNFIVLHVTVIMVLIGKVLWFFKMQFVLSKYSFGILMLCLIHPTMIPLVRLTLYSNYYIFLYLLPGFLTVTLLTIQRHLCVQTRSFPLVKLHHVCKLSVLWPHSGENGCTPVIALFFQLVLHLYNHFSFKPFPRV